MILETRNLDHLDEDSLAKQRHAAEAARAVENSTAWKIRRLLDNVALPSYQHTPHDLAAELNSCSDKRQDLRKRGDDGISRVREFVQAGDDAGDFGDLEAMLDSHRREQLSLLRDVAEFFVAAHDLAQRHAAALRPISDQLHSEAEKLVAQAKKDLNGIGFFVESMPGYSSANPDSAERRFDYLARHGIKAESAIREEEQARAECEAAVEVAKRIPECLKATRQLLQKITIKAVASSI